MKIEECDHLAREALADVKANRVSNHRAVQAWALCWHIGGTSKVSESGRLRSIEEFFYILYGLQLPDRFALSSDNIHIAVSIYSPAIFSVLTTQHRQRD